VQDRECQRLEQLVIIGKERPVDCNGLGYRGIGKVLGNPVTLGGVGDLCVKLGEVVVTVRMLAMSQKLRAFTPQVGAAPQEGTGGAPLGRIDRGLRQHGAAQAYSNLVGSALVIFGRAPLESLHREGVPQDEGQTLRSAKGSEPVPGADTFNSHHQTVPLGRTGFQTGFRSGLHRAVEQECPVVVHDTDRHTAGLQLSPTVKGVLVSVESHEVFSSFMSDFFQVQHTTGVCRGEASIIITALHLTASSVRSSVASAFGSR
jgi:hypothetical protein